MTSRYHHHALIYLGLLFTCETPLSAALQARAPLSTPTRIAKGPLFAETPSNQADSPSRRNLLTTALSTPLLALTASPQPAHAGLIQFPCKTLKNRYHFMRAGPSELEADGIYSTNPLFLTNRENGLLTNRKGTDAVLGACAVIKTSPNFPTVAYHSLAANGMDTADMVATELRISRDRLLPEFTYLDQRGIGLWDSGGFDNVKPAIVAMDYLEGGKMGTGGRPPANEDGTPNETLGDQFVRLRQFLSLQESRTSGENILIIFPDGTGPALLSAMIAGIPLNEAHCLDYKPGEVRLDITRESVLEQYEQRKEDPEYLAMIEDGKEKLAALRDQEGDVVNLKDQLREKERLKMEKEFALKKQQEREEEARKQAEARRLQQEREAEQRERAKQIQLEKAQAAAAKKAEDEARRAAKRQQVAGGGGASSSMPSKEDNQGMDVGAILGVLGVGIVGAGAAAVLGGGDNDDQAQTSTSGPAPVRSPDTNTVVMGANGTAAVAFAPATSVDDDVSIDLPLPKSSRSRARPASATPELRMVDDSDSNGGKPTPDDKDDDDKPEEPNPSSVEEELGKLEAAQEALFNTIDNIPPPKIKTEPILDKDSTENETVDQEMNRLEKAQEAMNDYFEMDDGGDDWLQVLAQIRDETDEEADRVNGEGRY